jgi:hypothetical protein
VLCSLITLGTGATIAAMRVGDRHGLGVTGTARHVAVIAALFTMAAGIHLVLALPEGVLAQRARQVAAGSWYAVAAALSVWTVASSRALAPWPSAVGWTLAVLVSLPALRARYVAAPARGRQRIQALAVGVTLAAMATLVVLTLHALVAWPSNLSLALLGVTGLVPLGLAAGSTPVASHADRALVHLLTTLGTVAIVSGAYLLAVKGFAKTPTTPTTRDLLWWAMVAAAVAAVGQLALRGRLARIATSATYGTREAPDEVVRSFGSRLTRAIPMDELLLQLVESLRKTLNLSAAEIYTGNSEVLELVVSVPDVGFRSLHVTGDEADHCASPRSVTPASCSASSWSHVPMAPWAFAKRTTESSPTWLVRWGSLCTTRNWTRRCRARSTNYVVRPTNCERRALVSSPVATPSAVASSATSTTGPSSTSSRSR